MYGYFHDEANIYFVMEYAENGSLFNHFEKKRRFSEPETARVSFAYNFHLYLDIIYR